MTITTTVDTLEKKRRFAEAIQECAAVYRVELDASLLNAYWRLLEDYPIEQVEMAFDVHMRHPERGRFFPKPADLIAAMQEADDERPGADEAWSLAVLAMDDAETVVWTDEIAEAWGVALPIFEAGDKVGARMAFREAYLRATERARQVGKPVKWQVTLGSDKNRRISALETAIAKGRLQRSQVAHLLPPPEPTGDGQSVAGLLTGKVTPLPQDPKTRERWAKLRQIIEHAPDPVDPRKEQERERRERIEREKRKQLAEIRKRLQDDEVAETQTL